MKATLKQKPNFTGIVLLALVIVSPFFMGWWSLIPIVIVLVIIVTILYSLKNYPIYQD